MAYQKINKRAAREYYNAGVTVLIAGDNVNEYHLEKGWCLAYRANKDKVEGNSVFSSFDSLVNDFQYYLPRELGRRAAYYLKV